MKHTDEQQADESGLEELIDEQAVAWFTRLRADNVSRAEKSAFADWLQQSPTIKRPLMKSACFGMIPH